ncbi:MAG: M1 family aminopeptidase [Bacteroidia bacterium]
MRICQILITAVVLALSQNSFAQKAVEAPSSCQEMKNLFLKTEPDNTNNAAASQPGDTIHVAHYKISVDTINFSAHTIRANTELTVVAKVNNVTTIYLSLLQLNIDSIIVNNLQVFYVYDDTTLTIPTITPLNTNDTAVVRIYYNGAPKTDASGWGGFYFSGTFAFNLGVGFAAIPHNLGKVWFPCLDNFTDRATYEFYINTPNTSKAFCNGELVSEIVNTNGTKTWYWRLNLPIPTYLACMAVAPFYTLTRTSNGIPVEWACLITDTINTLNTFQHIDTVLGAYINAYGTYPWNKVGYTEVPFNSGAMEHATAITIGKAFINGSLTYETLWAHELSHMWWGDKVTCKTSGDMWLNEGFATFNEAFTTENIYGIIPYKNWIRSNHHKVVQFAHVPQNDGAYLTMNNIPEDHTYGFTVYQKGGDVVHTLRNYLSDSLFFAGSKYYMNQFAYGNADSYDLRDALTAGTGVDMTRFFDDWVFTPGFPHFSIDSVVYVPGGLDHYFVYTRQRSRGNPNHIYSIPVDITFSNGLMDTTVTIQIDSATQMFHIPLVGVFDWVALDRSEKISDANVDYEKTATIGANVLIETNVTLNVSNTGSASSIVRVENNYVTPDGFKQSNPGIRLSDYHYWKVDGIFSTGFSSNATFNYDGTISATTGYLDNTLITGIEDSLVILYRQGTSDDWSIVNGYTVTFGASHVDKKGSIIIDTLKKGEYVFGYYDYTVGVSNISNTKNYSFSVQPNPSSGIYNFYFDLKRLNHATLRIFDERGTTVLDTALKSNQTSFLWDAGKFSKGIYFVLLRVNGEKIAVQKVVLTD